jgi:hypothetical protein
LHVVRESELAVQVRRSSATIFDVD